jgi:hypothetical protein
MRSLAAIGLCILSGCAALQQAQLNAVTVHELQPSPNVLVPSRGQAMSLEIAPGVLDAFTAEGDSNLTAVPVDGWHATLQNGFNAGFASSTGASPQIVVRIHRAKLDWIMTAAFARRERISGAAAAVARIQFAAEIFRDGVAVQQVTGEVLSTQPWTDAGGSSLTAREAVEKMYEEIAGKLIPLLG